MVNPILVAGEWKVGNHDETFVSTNPASGDNLDIWPVSTWDVVSQMLDAGGEAFDVMGEQGPHAWAKALDSLSDMIEERTLELATMAEQETSLGVEPRLVDVEIPRTIDQLRQAAQAARTHSWRQVVLSPEARIASMFAPIPGAVLVMGPNNFPFAFNSVTGGDAAAALATGHPIIAKANPGHPQTTRQLAELASLAAQDADLHPATFQLVYQVAPEDGERLVADRRLAATAFTGSRSSGMPLMRAANATGALIYLEMSSINPVIILDDALANSSAEIAHELSSSMLAGSGQFCTSPGLIFLVRTPNSDRFVKELAESLVDQPSGNSPNRSNL